MTQYILNNLSEHKAAMPLPAGSVTMSQIIQALELVKDIDWSSLVKIIENKDEQLAVLTTAEDVAKIIAPFVPQAALAVGVIEFLIFLSKNTHPSQPNSVPGYHWDILYGWVPNNQGE